MIIPSCETILELAGSYDVIPLCREIYVDVVTPITLLRKIAGMSRRYFLLESVEGGEKWGRYSFLGFDPILRVTCKNGMVTMEQDGVITRQETEHPLDVLRELLTHYRAPRLEGMPPFAGGLVGYFAYAMMGYAEPTLHIRRGEFNDYDLMLFDKVIAYDHLKQKIAIVVNMKNDRVMENYGKAVGEIEKIAAFIRESGPLPKQPCSEKVEFTCNVSKEEYCRVVEKTKEYIRDGDIFQAVISRQFVSSYEGSLMNAYRVLRTTNPSPYMVYFHMDGEEVMSTSPETLVRLQQGRLTTFPVAGSRPRGATEDELESQPRGIYGGALGYLDFTGNLDTCIAIRMAVKKDGKVYVQAGGGIVADSVPEREYEESANKAAAVIQAICRAKEVEN